MVKLAHIFVLKQWELRLKYASIQAELQAWQELTQDTQPLQKHHRQVLCISEGLSGMIEEVQEQVDMLQSPADIVEFFRGLATCEYLILEVHRTWHYFRQKLSIRQGPPFDTLLEALDEFVWACFHPHFTAPPEPPLTFFNSEWSPAASSRQQLLALEQTSDDRSARTSQLDETRLQHLLIPVISLPWYESTFLPEALLLAHETGHLLDYELQLTTDIQRNLTAPAPHGTQAAFQCPCQASGRLASATTAIDATRRDKYWLPWSAEVFADLYGVLCLGPAFVGALQMLLSRSRREVLETLDSQNSYPPHHLRMLIAMAALRSLDFVDEAAEVEATWNEAYGKPAPDGSGRYLVSGYVLEPCAADIEGVVKALLHTPFQALAEQGSARPLCQIDGVRWTKQNQTAALKVRNVLLSPLDQTLKWTDPRVLLAGAQLAFQQRPQLFADQASGEPNKSFDQSIQKLLIQRILDGREPGVRGRRAAEARADQQFDGSVARSKGRQVAQELLAHFKQRAQS